MYTVSVQQGKFTYEGRINFKISCYVKFLSFRTFKCTQPTSYIPPYVTTFHVYVALNYGSDLNIKRRKQTW
jgi:hypothetical protein